MILSGQAEPRPDTSYVNSDSIKASEQARLLSYPISLQIMRCPAVMNSKLTSKQAHLIRKRDSISVSP